MPDLGTLAARVTDHREALDDFAKLELVVPGLAIHAAEEARQPGWTPGGGAILGARGPRRGRLSGSPPVDTRASLMEPFDTEEFVGRRERRADRTRRGDST